MLDKDSQYIKRCIQLGSNALGTARPNPMVGALVVYKDQIIGEGYTSPYGGPHAEVNAINSVADKSLLPHSKLYVTLEPCSHYGKTPPCSQFIIAHNIPQVIIGCVDDNPEVAGKGIEHLITSGCDVNVGIEEQLCKFHHRRFFTFHNKKRPYIILKWAQTLDGIIAPKMKNEKVPLWISNKTSRQLVHKWRSEEQAILVGANTVMQDNPSLTVRDWLGHNPLRIVIDSHNSLDKTHIIFNDEAETIHLTPETIDFSKNVAEQVCEILYSKNISSVIIEGGVKTLQQFINEELWDEARVFIGNTNIANGVYAPHFEGRLISEQQIKNDLLKIYQHD